MHRGRSHHLLFFFLLKAMIVASVDVTVLTSSSPQILAWRILIVLQPWI